jgi:hypothetical protein
VERNLVQDPRFGIGFTSLCCGSEWSTVVITRRLIDSIGYFDENFYPAYYEVFYDAIVSLQCYCFFTVLLFLYSAIVLLFLWFRLKFKFVSAFIYFIFYYSSIHAVFQTFQHLPFLYLFCIFRIFLFHYFICNRNSSVRYEKRQMRNLFITAIPLSHGSWTSIPENGTQKLSLLIYFF